MSLQATAADADGTIARVEFLVDGAKVGEDVSAPYAVLWTATAGSHTVAARAIDNLGATTTSAAVSISVTPVTLPTGWSALDIGAPSLAGSSTSPAATDTWTVTGSGADIWNTSDGFHAATQTFTGDVTVEARVTAIDNPNPWAKAGIMLRDGTAVGAKHAFICVTAGNGIAFQRRVSSGGTSSHTAGSTARAPRWIKLQRSGSTFAAWESPDGVAWTKVGSTTIAMGASIRLMLAVTAHDSTRRCAATFTGVTISPSGNG